MSSESENRSSSHIDYGVAGKRFFVTGGAGFVGRRITKALLAQGAEHVAITDIKLPDEIAPGVTGYQGDIRDAAAVQQWITAAAPDCVFHIASYGMSGREMVTPQTTWSVNVEGTRNVCQASAQCGATVIYISTVNVCFDGTEVVNGCESMPYATGHVDAYSASKTEAEKLCRSYPGLRCICLRPYGIYGEGEERHFPRMIRYFRHGLFMYFGTPQDASDWVHVDNLVHAMLLSHRLLSTTREFDGAAYFIGDGEPVNTIIMCEELWVLTSGGPAAGLRTVWLPYRLLYFFGWLTELFYRLSHRLCRCSFEPLLSRAEVNKVARTHFWQTQRVTAELGYRPIVSRQEGLRRMFQYFAQQLRAQGYPKRYQRACARLQSAVYVLLPLLAHLLVLWVVIVFSAPRTTPLEHR
jgi:nucleoside-diphosphate-sugar epimerase